MELSSLDKFLYNSFNSNINNNIDNHYNHNSKNILNCIDLSTKFIPIYDQCNKGITSSCALTSVMSYYFKKHFNVTKLFSPYYLAYNQYMMTRSWETIDLHTGLNIATSSGICSDDLVTDGSNYNDINSEFIMSDASNYKFKNITNINLSIKNLKNLLSEEIPIICSLKIIPSLKNNRFFYYFDEDEYWNLTDEYYKFSNNTVYSISLVIVGYDDNTNKFKFRGCWGTNIGDCGYFYISYNVIDKYSHLFFDNYIVDIVNDTIDQSNRLELLFKELSSDINDDYKIFKLNDSIISPSNKFKKISSFNDLYLSTISIESIDDLDVITNNLKINFKLTDSII